MEQKVIKIGNSAGIIFPQKILKFLGLNTGDPVILEFDEETETLILSGRNGKYQQNGLTLSFYKDVKRVMNEHEGALRELADR